jgi:hypothetical protein
LSITGKVLYFGGSFVVKQERKMAEQQVEQTEVLSSNKRFPNNQPKLGSRLRHTNGAEREHRNRGWMRDSPRWRGIFITTKRGASSLL